MRVIERSSFFVGGEYTGVAGQEIMYGQMYVERWSPSDPLSRFPIVLIHGGWQTGMNWLSTPDGRPGWAPWFAQQGWEVLVVDQPARGRSAWETTHNRPLTPVRSDAVQAIFTAPRDAGLWPQARLHTQWPGTGHPGDPAFDQFFASQVPHVSRGEAEMLTRKACVALLEKVGPAILLVHSQSAGSAWGVADDRPDLVKALVALEPNGPPYKDAGIQSGGTERSWGLTTSQLRYEPPVSEDHPLTFEQQTSAEGPDLARCWFQTGSPRTLPNLSKVPVLLITAEASYHAAYDHCTVEYLRRAGVQVDFVRLEDRGICGNGHMMMLERNSHEIAGLIQAWLVESPLRLLSPAI